MLNYVADPSMLGRFIPQGTELDAWQGKTYVSLVGFLFANTRVLGISVPFHRTFEEVNLRFYVRRTVGGEARRAVTFIRELVPRSAIAMVARLAYNEPYAALPMRHEFGEAVNGEVPGSVEYAWRRKGSWSGIRAKVTGAGHPVVAGSQEEFITEHYWGYTKQRDGSTVEYQVTHPSWRVWKVEASAVFGDVAGLYGADFARILSGPPDSAFLADGSAVAVHNPTRGIRG